MLRTEICNRRTLRVPMSQCDAPGSAERDPDDGFVERPWRAAAAFVRRSGLPAGDGPCRTAAERVRHSRMTPVPQPSVTLVTEAPTLMGIDPFVPGSMLLTYPRSETRDANAGSPRSNRVLGLPMVGSGCLVEFSSPKGAGTRGHSITSVITTATRARRRRPYPRETPSVPLAWPPRIVFLLRAAPTDHPKATDRCRRCPAPLFSDPFCTRLRNA